MVVEADVFTDGHDVVTCLLLHRREGASEWTEVAMSPMHNDRWFARFVPQEMGKYHYTVRAWVDHLATWKRDIAKKQAAGQDVAVDLLRGKQLEKAGVDREIIVQHEPPCVVEVDRERARFSTWYELFPRSTAAKGEHGTFRDVEARLAYVASMGFDILYLPPIHPIGLTERKGPNNKAGGTKDDRGSPWAIGGAAGGHKAIHPQLGNGGRFPPARRQGEGARHRDRARTSRSR